MFIFLIVPIHLTFWFYLVLYFIGFGYVAKFKLHIKTHVYVQVNVKQ